MSKTKERIHDSNLRYKQGLGQNFIYDEDLLAALVASSEITKDDDVLEIGPGAGSMTKYLCDAAHHVLSVELDERLIPLLTAFLAERDNFTLVQGDATAAVNSAKVEKKNADAPMYNMAGQRVNKDYKGVVIQNGTKRINK